MDVLTDGISRISLQSKHVQLPPDSDLDTDTDSDDDVMSIDLMETENQCLNAESFHEATVDPLDTNQNHITSGITGECVSVSTFGRNGSISGDIDSSNTSRMRRSGEKPNWCLQKEFQNIFISLLMFLLVDIFESSGRQMYDHTMSLCRRSLFLVPVLGVQIIAVYDLWRCRLWRRPRKERRAKSVRYLPYLGLKRISNITLRYFLWIGYFCCRCTLALCCVWWLSIDRRRRWDVIKQVSFYAFLSVHGLGKHC